MVLPTFLKKKLSRSFREPNGPMSYAMYLFHPQNLYRNVILYHSSMSTFCSKIIRNICMNMSP